MIARNISLNTYLLIALLCACALLLAPQKAMAKVIFLTTTGAQSWTVPSDWNDNNNTIEVIGGGGGGADNGATTGGGGGAGGAYSSISNVNLTPGASVSYFVGTGGTRGANGGTGGDTYFNGASCGAASACAKAGTGGTGAGAAGTGGAAGSGTGTVKKSGGNGGSASGLGGGAGGGGAAGPHGDGKAGGNGVSGGGGGGGGGANDGAVGENGFGDQGSAGGNGRGGFGGGSPGNAVGGNGSHGGGGAGGDALYQDENNNGGTGGKDLVWTQSSNSATAGPGGGGGGGGSVDDDSCSCFGAGDGGTGASGAYGSGGGGGGAEITLFGQGLGGVGSQGIVVITYASALSKPANNLGLIGYWSFNDGAGNIAGDSSGNGNHGTSSSALAWVSGRLGKALNFDGVDGSQLDVGNPAVLRPSAALTVAGWVYHTSTAGDKSLASKSSGGGDSSGAYLCRVNGSTNLPRFALTTSAGSATLTGNTSLDMGRWYHLACVWDGTQTLVYLNGVSDATPGSLAGTFGNNGLNLGIGGQGNGGGRVFIGKLDDVRMYSRALSASELAALYANGGAVKLGGSSVDLQKGSTLANGLMGHWTFDGLNVTTTVADSSGNGNHGYIYGRATSSVKTMGRLGQALDFDDDGSGDSVRVADNPSLDLSSTVTIAAWIETSSINQDGGIVSKREACEDEGNYAFFIRGDNRMQFEHYTAGAWQVSNSTGLWTRGAWNHVAVTFDTATDEVKFYINGAGAGTVSDTTALTTDANAIDIGTNGQCGDNLDAMLDDVRIYSRVLSASEIKQLYTLGNAVIRR